MPGDEEFLARAKDRFLYLGIIACKCMKVMRIDESMEYTSQLFVELWL